MNDKQREIINYTMVRLFNQILDVEESRLRKSSFNDLTMREFHVIEIISRSGKNNTMSPLAEMLHITIGSLTVAITTLEHKGYVERSRSDVDKRKVHVTLTKKGELVNATHDAFHEEMTNAVMNALPENELEVLITALERIDKYFSDNENMDIL